MVVNVKMKAQAASFWSRTEFADKNWFRLDLWTETKGGELKWLLKMPCSGTGVASIFFGAVVD